MNVPPTENRASLEPDTEAMMQKMLETQLSLEKNITTTAQFLKFVLALANENLGVIRAQLETIRDLALEIDKRDDFPDR